MGYFTRTRRISQFREGSKLVFSCFNQFAQAVLGHVQVGKASVELGQIQQKVLARRTRYEST